jgi:hypothetical protein
MLCWVPVSSLRYVFITFMPNLGLHSPHLLIIGLFGGMEKLAEEAVKKWRMEIDFRILNRLFDAPMKDSDLMRFLKTPMASVDHQ